MTWQRLVVQSTASAALAVLLITVATPKTAVAETGACGDYTHNLCRQTCNKECSNGSCCDWSYYYYSTS